MKNSSNIDDVSVSAVLRDALKTRGLSQERLADSLGVSRLSVNQLVNGKRSVSAEMAIRLSVVLGTTPQFWLNLQRDNDLKLAFERLKADATFRVPRGFSTREP